MAHLRASAMELLESEEWEDPSRARRWAGREGSTGEGDNFHPENLGEFIMIHHDLSMIYCAHDLSMIYP